MAEVGILVAVVAGLASFVAPCILPVIPAFLAYISGTTISGLSENSTVQISRSSVILNTVFFVTGFSVVFSILGVIINTVLSDVAGDLIGTLNHIGGIIIISFGVYMILSIKIAKLNMEKKFIPKMSKASYPTSFLFGLAFAAGWIGPVLGTILTLASKSAFGEKIIPTEISIKPCYVGQRTYNLRTNIPDIVQYTLSSIAFCSSSGDVLI